MSRLALLLPLLLCACDAVPRCYTVYKSDGTTRLIRADRLIQEFGNLKFMVGEGIAVALIPQSSVREVLGGRCE